MSHPPTSTGLRPSASDSAPPGVELTATTALKPATMRNAANADTPSDCARSIRNASLELPSENTNTIARKTQNRAPSAAPPSAGVEAMPARHSRLEAAGLEVEAAASGVEPADRAGYDA